ncbi:hypothetical protein K461DRAFT_37795 [Myriangium duriaei CBS 260.36]|uniref:Uncharacterized protein n=1 Tax=Myriangium duriaei CBS 260.36 TaxID=1168546 RepID=A0A9P4MEI2_9PEZI|nr:hypothetical protein K461DRAFT_37795 [Myriangium duriaei CBS 260.36]
MQDIIAAHQTATSAPENKDQIQRFLSTYPESQINHVLTGQQLVYMVWYHFKYILPLRNSYFDWASHKLADSSGINSLARIPPTQTEMLRITKALYRYQLGCNLFGTEPDMFNEASFDIDEIFNDRSAIVDEKNDWFLRKFEPWDVEAIFCIYRWAGSFYEELFAYHRGDLSIDGERFHPDEDVVEFTEKLDILSGAGLPLLYNLMIGITDFYAILYTVQQVLDDPYRSAFLEWDTRFCYNAFNGHHETDPLGSEPPLPFTSDAVDKPPLAWTMLWQNGKVSDIGHLKHGIQSLQSWGFVMWDSERTQYEGVRALVGRQWKWR